MKSMLGCLIFAWFLPSALAASKSYKSIDKNDDGSFSIIEPFFSAAGGSNRFFSSKSDTNGLCRLYGFEQAARNGAYIIGDLRDNTVVINSEGKFEGYFEFNSLKNNSWIQSIICSKSGSTTKPSKHYSEKLSNDDGSTSIVDPYFSNATGASLWFSSKSNMDGLCALYGFSSYVENSLTSRDDINDPTVIIGETGTFAGYFFFNRNKVNARITSFICE